MIGPVLWFVGGLVALGAIAKNWGSIVEAVDGEPSDEGPQDSYELQPGERWYLILNFANRLTGEAQEIALDLAEMLQGLGLKPRGVRVVSNADGVALNRTFQVVVDVEGEAKLVTNHWFNVRPPSGESVRVRITRAREIPATEEAAAELWREVLAQPGVTLLDV